MSPQVTTAPDSISGAGTAATSGWYRRASALGSSPPPLTRFLQASSASPAGSSSACYTLANHLKARYGPLWGGPIGIAPGATGAIPGIMKQALISVRNRKLDFLTALTARSTTIQFSAVYRAAAACATAPALPPRPPPPAGKPWSAPRSRSGSAATRLETAPQNHHEGYQKLSSASFRGSPSNC